MTQLSLFAPKPCACGGNPEVYNLPNYGPNGEWKVGHNFRCPRASGKDEIEAVENYNEGKFQNVA